MAGNDDADEVRIAMALLDAYRQDHVGADGGERGDPILSLRGMGKALWAEEDADACVSRLRQGWE